MRKRPVFTLAAVAVIGALLYLLFRPPIARVSLRARSRHYPALSGKVSLLGCQWLSDGRLVVERHGKGGLREVYRIDPGSSSEKLLFRYAVAGNGLAFDDAGSLSPNGRWRITTMQKQFLVTSLDGARRIVSPNNTNRLPLQRTARYDRTVAWLPDGSQWVELANANGQN